MIKTLFKIYDFLKTHPARVKGFRLERRGRKYCIVADMPFGGRTIGRYSTYAAARQDFERLKNIYAASKAANGH